MQIGDSVACPERSEWEDVLPKGSCVGRAFYFCRLFFQISLENPMNTEPIIELSICSKR